MRIWVGATDQWIPLLETLGLDCILLGEYFRIREILTSFPSKSEELPAQLFDDLARDLLISINLYIRDECLYFRSEDHIYFWKGKHIAYSITYFAHQFPESFYEERIIDLMRNSKRQELTTDWIFEVWNSIKSVETLEDHA